MVGDIWKSGRDWQADTNPLRTDQALCLSLGSEEE